MWLMQVRRFRTLICAGRPRRRRIHVGEEAGMVEPSDCASARSSSADSAAVGPMPSSGNCAGSSTETESGLTWGEPAAALALYSRRIPAVSPSRSGRKSPVELSEEGCMTEYCPESGLVGGTLTLDLNLPLSA